MKKLMILLSKERSVSTCLRLRGIEISIDMLLIFPLCILLLSSCSGDSSDNDDVDTDTDTVEELTSPLEGAGEVEIVASGLISTEGPAWHESSETLFFSDIPGSTIYRLDANTLELETFRSPSNTANGLAFDNEGYLLAAEQETRLISRMDISTGEISDYIETVNFGEEDLLFNSPNDMAVHSNGNIYFTDPSFGLGDGVSDIGFNGFYLRTPDGNIELVRAFEYETEESPNGVILNADESILYLAVSHDESGPILAYDVDEEGNLSGEREFAFGQNNDGMAIDEEGNVYVATLLGVEVWSEEGDYWGIISLPEEIRTTNAAFGNFDKSTLYITNRSSDLYSIELNVVGHQ